MVLRGTQRLKLSIVELFIFGLGVDADVAGVKGERAARLMSMGRFRELRIWNTARSHDLL